MQEQIKKMLSEAVYAPSGDNSQPWRFVVSGEILEIYNLPDKDLPFYNFRQNGSLVAHGALVENLRIVASHYGYVLEEELILDIDSSLIARIRFARQDIPEDPLYTYIKERITNRKPYKREPFGEENRTALSSQVMGDFQLRFQDNLEILDKLGPAMSLNEKVALENKIVHDQFFQGLVWTDAQEIMQKSGLYVKTMEFNPVQKLIFSLYKDWAKAKVLNYLGFSKLIQKENGKLYASSSAIAAIVSNGNNSIDFFNTGRTVQRIWLQATKDNISVHPVTGILFLMQRIIAGQAEGLSEEHQKDIKEAYTFMQQSLGAESNQHLTFMFRFGHGEPPSGKTSRKEPAIEIR